MGLVDERKLKYKDGGGGALPTYQFIISVSLFGSYCYWFRLVQGTLLAGAHENNFVHKSLLLG